MDNIVAGFALQPARSDKEKKKRKSEESRILDLGSRGTTLETRQESDKGRTEGFSDV